MEKKHIFTGTATALVTPMNESGVDYEALGKLIDWQIAGGVKALVVCATTGEAPTLTDNEHCKVLEFAIARSGHRVPIIAGTGSNDTAHAIMMTQFACAIGADAVLCVTPYYNRPTQSGLIASFSAIADASTAPVILYNVPSRTGTNIEPETCSVLADHPNICAIKEASGRLTKIMETLRLVEGRLDVYSGNDDQILPLLAMGAKGVISVLANVVPAQAVELCEKFFAGDLQGAARLQLELLPLIQTLWFGPLYLLAVGLPSLLWAGLPALQRRRRSRNIGYDAVYPEKQASALGRRFAKQAPPAEQPTGDGAGQAL